MIPTGQEEEGEDQQVTRTLQLTDAFLKANNPDDPTDQGSNPTLTGAEAKCGLILAMAIPGKGNDSPRIAKRLADWLAGGPAAMSEPQRRPAERSVGDGQFPRENKVM